MVQFEPKELPSPDSRNEKLMIKLKVGNLVGAFQSGALSRLANTNLPVKTASQLKRVLEAAQTAMKTYEDDRIAVCKKFGTLNEESGDFEFLDPDGEFDKEVFAEFQKEAGELLQKELEFPGSPFGITHFYSTTSITANDLMILDWLIVVETDAQSSSVSS